MNKRIISALLLAVIVILLFSGCGQQNEKNVISQTQAQSIALEDAGLSAKQVTGLHCHPTSANNIPAYNIHFTYNNTEYSYIINAVTGEIISSN